LVSAFSPRRCEPRHWRSCESWRKAEVLIPNGCPSIPLRTGARLLPGWPSVMAEDWAHDAHTL